VRFEVAGFIFLLCRCWPIREMEELAQLKQVIALPIFQDFEAVGEEATLLPQNGFC